ncbi:MAG: DUF2199 domain-containing protein [Verrucomicrobiales bacterium]|nr:DUF2199 domain-containing protein [Verrucomicrobiales bacterium]
MTFVCTTCGKQHELDDLSFGAHAPLQWDALTEAERKRSLLGNEQCEVDDSEGRHFYVCACLEIPVREAKRAFVELEPTDHPLAVDQRLGIEEDRLQAIVTKLLHAAPA